MADAKHTPMVIAAARELCRQHAVACEVNKDDCWNLYAEDFKKDAQRVLDAAGVPQLLEALQAFMALDKSFNTICDQHLDEMAKEGPMARAVQLARAAIAKASA